MGPRLVSRGKWRKMSIGEDIDWLQWGRDLLVEESPSTPFQENPLICASMGPRLVSRGKIELIKLHSKIASLQWGRDLLVAESALLVVGLLWLNARFNGAATC